MRTGTSANDGKASLYRPRCRLFVHRKGFLPSPSVRAGHISSPPQESQSYFYLLPPSYSPLLLQNKSTIGGADNPANGSSAALPTISSGRTDRDTPPSPPPVGQRGTAIAPTALARLGSSPSDAGPAHTTVHTSLPKPQSRHPRR